MGYYSHFALKPVHEDGRATTAEDIFNVLEAIAKLWEKDNEKFYPFEDYIGMLEDDKDSIEDSLTEEMELEPEEEAKWYDYDRDMKELSLLLPGVLLKLHVEGEESGDITDNYFKDGLSCSYNCQMPPFNPEDLR